MVLVSDIRILGLQLVLVSSVSEYAIGALASSFLGSDMNFFLPQQIEEFMHPVFLVGTVHDHFRGLVIFLGLGH
jgi:hypothetical protein